jgi:hypothetical protein
VRACAVHCGGVGDQAWYGTGSGTVRVCVLFFSVLQVKGGKGIHSLLEVDGVLVERSGDLLVL